MDTVQRVVLLALSVDELALVRHAVCELLNEGANRDDLRDRCHTLLSRLPADRPRKPGEPGPEG